MVSVLERLDVSVDFPRKQTCCGQMHFNTGYGDMAIPLLENFVEAFHRSTHIVSTSASCAAMIKENYLSLAERTGKQNLIKGVEALLPKIFEFSQYLTEVLGVLDVGAYYPHRVTYHPTCHSLRSLGIYDSAIKLLSNIRGIEIVELPSAEQCCGFGGTFAIKNADMSTAMLFDKISNIKSTKAETVVGLDNSCLMHIGGGLSRNNSGVSVLHLAEVLASGICESDS